MIRSWEWYLRLTVLRLQTLFGFGLHTEPPPVRAKGQSLFLRHVDGGSSNACEQELVAIGSPVYDLPAYGVHFVASPRHADALVVTGPLTWNMVKPLTEAFAVMCEPRCVVAIGPYLGVAEEAVGADQQGETDRVISAHSEMAGIINMAAVFADSYATLALPPQVADHCIAVIAQDPPTPEQLLRTLLTLEVPRPNATASASATTKVG